jgi:hypothetical protein
LLKLPPAERGGPYLDAVAEGMRKSVLKMTMATQIRYGEVKPEPAAETSDPLGVTFGRRPTALGFDAPHNLQASMLSYWIDALLALLWRFSRITGMPANIVRDVAQAKLNKPWMRWRVAQSID